MSKDSESHTYPDGSKITITARSVETLKDMAARLADLSNGDPVLEVEILDALQTVEERCQEFLTAAETDNKKLREALTIYVNAPPAQMSWSRGLVNIDSTGMREVVDALAEAEARIQELQAAIDFILTNETQLDPGACYTLPNGDCVAPRCKLHNEV